MGYEINRPIIDKEPTWFKEFIIQNNKRFDNIDNRLDKLEENQKKTDDTLKKIDDILKKNDLK